MKKLKKNFRTKKHTIELMIGQNCRCPDSCGGNINVFAQNTSTTLANVFNALFHHQ